MFKRKEKEIIGIEKYKKQIDKDFKEFPLSNRFIRLEKAWIRDISHQIMPSRRSFIHNDRRELRKTLFSYLNQKRKEYDKRGLKND